MRLKRYVGKKKLFGGEVKYSRDGYVVIERAHAEELLRHFEGDEDFPYYIPIDGEDRYIKKSELRKELGELG